MASIVLSGVGSAVGSALGGPIGGFLGGKVGNFLGGGIGNSIFGGKSTVRSKRSQLTDLAVQSSAYGKMIPILYGTLRIAGNIIWSRPIQEIATTTTSSAGIGGKGGGGRVTQSQTSYSYSVTLAIAICEGPIDTILRVWADAKQLDLSTINIRIYKGTEEQLPDSLIQSYEGAGATPAYRGLAYVVIEDFPLEIYGNRIPNFTFEVQKKIQAVDYDDQILENAVTGITLIPGAGEFVYDTQAEYKVNGELVGADWVQQGLQSAVNLHTPYGKPNILVALDQLKDTCPNVEWVSVVVSWFGDNIDANMCDIKPGVEYQSGATTTPYTWQVGSYTRSTARQITLVSGSPQYGGTPDDNSVLRLITELKNRGYKVVLYPMIFMDVVGKPWRGTLTTGAAHISNFFTKTHGYYDFVMHYANLVAGEVDAFIIGSELVGLTKVTNTPGNYPAVNQLVTLAGMVKPIVGSGTKVTYAADWSEYHHTDGGWYHMDPLWACPDIDMVGIDAYFPLTDSASNSYDIDSIKGGWASGEGYDWYYTDSSRTTQSSLSASYAWKNIEWFWNNTHTNPDSSVTAWTPQLKKIWFTEYGFPSVDCASNQPNVFYDSTTSSSALPYFSKGKVDFLAQRVAIAATISNWAESDMVEQMFLWTWDARPYPYWPDLNSVWADGEVWKTGHWVQGKFGLSSLGAIVGDLCKRAGLQEEECDVSAIYKQLNGFAILQPESVRSFIEQLQSTYFFDAVESDYTLKFIPRGGISIQTLQYDALVALEDRKKAPLEITRVQEVELPKQVNVLYMNPLYHYQTAAQYSERQVAESSEVVNLDLPVSLSDQEAKNIADITLYSAWVSRNQYRFGIGPCNLLLEPTDVISVSTDEGLHLMRITHAQIGAGGIIEIDALAVDDGIYDFYSAPATSGNVVEIHQQIAKTQLELLDLPLLPGDGERDSCLRFAAHGLASNWQGAVLFRADNEDSEYSKIAGISAHAIMGKTIGILGTGNSCLFDYASSVEVVLLGDGQLYNASEIEILNGANAALIGDEIVQFMNAELISAAKYKLSGFLRGRLGTEYAIGGHMAGERFILLNGSIGKINIASGLYNLPRLYKAVSIGDTLDSAIADEFTYYAIALKPYSPVHVSATRDGTGNISIFWIRRTRFGGEWQDNIDVPLGESFEQYEVDVYNGSNIVRTITGINATTTTYSSANQIIDFGALQPSLHIKIYQISAYTGRGYAADVII